MFLLLFSQPKKRNDNENFVFLSKLVDEFNSVLEEEINSIRSGDFSDNLTIDSSISKRSQHSSCTNKSWIG